MQARRVAAAADKDGRHKLSLSAMRQVRTTHTQTHTHTHIHTQALDAREVPTVNCLERRDLVDKLLPLLPSFKVSELKRMFEISKVDVSDCLERSDLVRKATELAP